MHQTAVTTCEYCGKPVPYGSVVCPSCGALTYRRLLEQIAGEAMRLEPVNPAAAAMLWRQALDLLPADSAQYAQVYSRIGALASGWSPAASQSGPPPLPSPGSWKPGVREIPQPLGGSQRAVRPPDPWPLAVTKTVGSMIISIAVYCVVLFGNFPFAIGLAIAIGFVVLMLVHEMGHVLAMRYYKISASPPIFIPFLGALINMRQQPPNALVESIVGIGGPLLGTVGALACYALAFAAHGTLRLELLYSAQLAFMLNLFNLLPVPPLDGGRVTAAISPWIWLAGLGGLGWMILHELIGMRTDPKNNSWFGLTIPVLILMYALPRIMLTLRLRKQDLPYYRVSRAASWTMTALYLGLAGVLAFMFFHLGAWNFLEHPGLQPN